MPKFDSLMSGDHGASEVAIRIGLVAFGGALGALARFGLGFALNKPLARYPFLGTLTANIVGSFLLGLLVVWSDSFPPRWRTFAILGLGTGFLGAMTTFSTFHYEAHQLIVREDGRMIVLHMAAGIVGGLLAVALGMGVGSWLRH